ncbi:MAG: hypothetical protein JO267_04775 [Alphaproteobacteria bacterium]|nr:hypothetical protein [Alphaproteobacteria bacterium]MBV9861445.1 hypothetical protein [Alphaproteobacteria bacterium]
MNDDISVDGPTSSATTPETEPAVLAAIASGEGQPYRPPPRRRHLDWQMRVILLGSGVALGLMAALWSRRSR